MLGAPQVGLMLKGRSQRRPFRALSSPPLTQGYGRCAASTPGFAAPRFQRFILPSLTRMPCGTGSSRSPISWVLLPRVLAMVSLA